MPRFKRARWKGPVPNRTVGGMQRPILGLVLHIQEGTEEGTDAWFHNSKAQASAHFGNPKKGRLDQWVDTDDKAWAEVSGNPRWISVENEGHSGDKLTDSQIENCAHLLAWLHTTEGVPLRVTDSVGKGGLGWHGMGGDAWGGHTACPGRPIVEQRGHIITRARELTEGANPKPPKPAHRPTTKKRYRRWMRWINYWHRK
jgi:hypothetical protein